MQINNFPSHIFWSYKPDANLPDELVAEQVLLHGDIEDMLLLLRLMDEEKIIRATNKIEASGRWIKRVNFINKVLLSK